jgi:hypothetical protein
VYDSLEAEFRRDYAFFVYPSAIGAWRRVAELEAEIEKQEPCMRG